MSSSASPESIPSVQRTFSPAGAVLSYLVPGLGQIAQGRIGKGLLFFFCLYGLFFYGEYLGEWRNVYVSESGPQQAMANQPPRNRVVELITDKARFFSQFWIGVAAWPAIIQHVTFNPAQNSHPVLGTYQRRPTEDEINVELRNSDKSPDLGWMYTVIAGVLNILVIYDALAGPAFGPVNERATGKEPAVA